MNVLRNDRDNDERLSTADIVNPNRNRTDAPRDPSTAGLEPSHNDRLDAAPGSNRRPGGLPEGSVVTDRQVVHVDRQVLYPEGQAPEAVGRTDPRNLDRNVDRNVDRNSARTPAQPRPPMSAAPNDPPDYTPPPPRASNDQPGIAPRSAQPIPGQIPPAAPVAAVPAPATGSQPGPVAVPAGATGPARPGPLFPELELHNFRARWDQVQTSFVDEPRKAVESADSLVANVVKRIAEQFANERESLERQWDRGDDINTEELRQAFKRYRAFFDRLLAF